MATKLDARQWTIRSILSRITGVIDSEGDNIVRAIDNELTPPLEMRASTTPDLVLNVGPITLQNPETLTRRVTPPIAALIPTFTSGTVTFPASTGGSTTNSTAGSNIVITVASGNFLKVGINVDSAGNFALQAGTEGASVAAATTPANVAAAFGCGYVVLENVAGTIRAITNADIYQYVEGSSALALTPYSSSVAGVTSTGRQNASGLKGFLDGAYSIGRIYSTDANLTLTDDDKRHVTFTGLTVTRDCILPTTNILAGDVWTIENTNAFDLVVKASAGSALTIANTANMDATIRSGRVVLQARQNTPTTPAHWRVVSVQEVFSENLIFNNNAGAGGHTFTMKYIRDNQRIIATFHANGTITTRGTGSFADLLCDSSASNPIITTRFRPTLSSVDFPTATRINGAYQTEMSVLRLNSSGVVQLYKNGDLAGGFYPNTAAVNPSDTGVSYHTL